VKIALRGRGDLDVFNHIVEFGKISLSVSPFL
jgi:hypothetical protein